jgi:hypothetical protein
MANGTYVPLCHVVYRVWKEHYYRIDISPSVDMLPFGVTIPASVSQRSEIPEGLMSYPVVIPIFYWNDNCKNTTFRSFV